MAISPVRQHYALATTGKAFKKGGSVKAKKNDADADDMKCGGKVAKKKK
jgi:hypothetical protein